MRNDNDRQLRPGSKAWIVGLVAAAVLSMGPATVDAQDKAAKQPLKIDALKAGDALPRGEWVDLMPALSPEWCAVSGNWRLQDNALFTGPDFYSRLLLPVVIAGDFEFSGAFTRLEGDGSANVLLPVGNTTCCVYYSGWHQSVHGLGRIQGMLPTDPDNPTGVQPAKLINGVRYTFHTAVRLDGDEATVEASLDGNLLFTWTGPASQLDVQPVLNLPEPHRAAIGAVGGTYRFDSLALRAMTDGSTVAAVPKAPEIDLAESGWKDLLAGLDLEQATIHGRWLIEEQSLRLAPAAAGQNHNRIMLPETIQSDYDLVVDFTRTSGFDSIVFILPVGGRHAALHISALGGRQGGLEMVDEKNIADWGNPTLRRPNAIPNGQQHRLVLQVRVSERNASIKAWLNAKPLLRWSGPEASLAVPADWRLPNRDAIGLGANQINIVFHAAHVRKVAGDSN
jgi:hypothetical protein